MGPKKCTVNDKFFDQKDCNGHMIKAWASKKDDTKVRCNLCNSDISVVAEGLQALTQHAGTEKHKTAAADLRGTQLVLNNGGQVTIFLLFSSHFSSVFFSVLIYYFLTGTSARRRRFSYNYWEEQHDQRNAWAYAATSYVNKRFCYEC